MSESASTKAAPKGTETSSHSIEDRLKELRAERTAYTSSVAKQSPDSGFMPVGINALTIGGLVLLFGFLVMLLAVYLVRAGRKPQAVLRLLGTLTIITLAMFLVVVGYSDQQITLVMGLLGTVVGYLLGKDQEPSTGDKSPNSAPPK